MTTDSNGMPLHDWRAFDDPYQFYSTVPYVRGLRTLAGAAVKGE